MPAFGSEISPVSTDDSLTAKLNGITIIPCPISQLPEDQCFSNIMNDLATNQSAFKEISNLTQIPKSIIEGLVAFERYGNERGAINPVVQLIKDRVGGYLKGDSTSIGWAQIQPRIMTDLRNWNRSRKNACIGNRGCGTSQSDQLVQLERDEKISAIVSVPTDSISEHLLDPAFNTKVAGLYLRKLFEDFGKIPGKSPVDQMKFAIAGYKLGPAVVHNAQEAAAEDCENRKERELMVNSWNSVSQHLDRGVVSYVNQIMTFPGVETLCSPKEKPLLASNKASVN